MRAVNLIPSDQQRGAGGAAGKSGGGAYILLGVLGLLVVLAAGFVVSGKSVTDKKAQLADITQQAAAAEAKAQSLTSYTKFASIRQKRVDTVSQLAASRFDWAHALREVARVLPENAWLTTLTATTSTSVNVGTGGSALRGALNVPAIQVQGCTTSQASVAKLIARLRLIDGVQRVTLEDSTKGQEAQGGSSSSNATSGSTGDCRGGHSKFPIFNVDVFFEQGSTVPSAGTGTTGTASSTAPAGTQTASSTVPASSTTGGTSK
ncbi:MAG TPA: PilN domain-containing protein [Baekduia sp.]|nr:PilN domain-containing protein [Baekduia sp.]